MQLTLASSIDDMNITVRSYNCLRNYGIKTVAELLDVKPKELLKAQNFGKKSLNEIKMVLAEAGFNWYNWHGPTVDVDKTEQIKLLEEENRRLRGIIAQIRLLTE